MNRHGVHFDYFFNKIKESEKYSETEMLWHGVLLCVLVASKNDKLDF